jgi:elongation factor P hydroxylase
MHNITDLQKIFDGCFASSHNTRLVKGFDEPIYLPAGKSYVPTNVAEQGESTPGESHQRQAQAQPKQIPAQEYAQVVFAHGFYQSALHEIAHWCIAGEQRRQQVDYGYWYSPDGRTASQQAQFEQAEIKPQAIEWAFSRACRRKFKASCDNLAGDEFGQQPDHVVFQHQIEKQLREYDVNGFPPRAKIFIDALAAYYQKSNVTQIGKGIESAA